jgi:hypothetical protein
MALTPAGLDDAEVALLGVLSIGLPPSRAAGDDRFRVDHVAAVVAGLRERGDERSHLQDDGIAVNPEFRERLAAAVASLTEKGVLAEQPASMPAAPGGFEAGLAIDMVNPDLHPALLDRVLSQECMEVLFRVPAVYPYLMGMYAKSGEVWRRLREDGYAGD